MKECVGDNTKDIMSNLNYDVIIVGAGPVGLLLALKLGLGGVRTLVLEKHHEILEAPRAIAYLPIVNRELEKMGILEAVLSEAHGSRTGPCWRKLDTTILAAIGPHEDGNGALDSIDEVKKDLDKMTLMIGQEVLSRIVLRALQERCKGVVDVNFGSQCVGVQAARDSNGHVKVMTSTGAGKSLDVSETVHRGSWVVGADGANSFVRRVCCIPFEGFTWHTFRFTAADIEYKFDVEGQYRPINYIVDENEWAVIARTGPRNVWRVAYGEKVDLPTDSESIIERSKQRIPRYLPGSKNYRLRRAKPYWAQQRCASTFRAEHALLVGDAAHSNNPIGGLGLTSGILDVAAVGNAMVRCIVGKEGETIVDEAAQSRRSVWKDHVDRLSQVNFRRLHGQDEEACGEREVFMHRLNTDETFPMQLGQELDGMLPQTFEAEPGSKTVL